MAEVAIAEVAMAEVAIAEVAIAEVDRLLRLGIIRRSDRRSNGRHDNSPHGNRTDGDGGGSHHGTRNHGHPLLGYHGLPSPWRQSLARRSEGTYGNPLDVCLRMVQRLCGDGAGWFGGLCGDCARVGEMGTRRDVYSGEMR